MATSKQSASNGRRYLLVLTGQCRGRSYALIVKGKEVSLARRLFVILCELAYVKATAKGPASVRIRKQDVLLIRRAFGEPPCTSRKPSLVEPTTKGHYELMLIKAQIALDRSFFTSDLPEHYRGRAMRRAYATLELSINDR